MQIHKIISYFIILLSIVFALIIYIASYRAVVRPLIMSELPIITCPIESCSRVKIESVVDSDKSGGRAVYQYLSEKNALNRVNKKDINNPGNSKINRNINLITHQRNNDVSAVTNRDSANDEVYNEIMVILERKRSSNDDEEDDDNSLSEVNNRQNSSSTSVNAAAGGEVDNKKEGYGIGDDSIFNFTTIRG